MVIISNKLASNKASKIIFAEMVSCKLPFIAKVSLFKTARAVVPNTIPVPLYVSEALMMSL